jgi:hypothetical protein
MAACVVRAVLPVHPLPEGEIFYHKISRLQTEFSRLPGNRRVAG